MNCGELGITPGRGPRREEFCERVESALQARLGGELARVQAGLPEVAVDLAGSRRRPTRLTAALLGHVTRGGRLRLRRWALAASAFGDLDFDLRDAVRDGALRPPPPLGPPPRPPAPPIRPSPRTGP